MGKRTEVGVQIAWGSTVCNDIVQGIREFSMSRPGWLLRHVENFTHPDLTRPGNMRWMPEAAICAGPPEVFNGRYETFMGPIVAIGSTPYECDVRIELDQHAIGVMAAEYFLELGYRNFAFQGGNTNDYVALRQQAFAKTIEKRGYICETSPVLLEANLWTAENPITAWLKSLPKPLAVLCAADRVARELLMVCHVSRLRVPEDVAVLGIDNEQIWCETTTPQLSSVVISWRRVGFEAARWLDKLLRGKSAPASGSVIISPERIITRQSTDVTAVQDEELRVALNYIRQHACEGLSVKQLVHTLKMERRSLERKCRSCLGRSLHDEIRRIQLERAKMILTQTDMPVSEVAGQAGLSRAHFMDVFVKAVGRSPLAYRQMHRLRS